MGSAIRRAQGRRLHRPQAAHHSHLDEWNGGANLLESCLMGTLVLQIGLAAACCVVAGTAEVRHWRRSHDWVWCAGIICGLVIGSV